MTLYLDDDNVADGRVEATVPMVFSLDETAMLGGTRLVDLDSQSAGRIDWVGIDVDAAAADEDHLISREGRLPACHQMPTLVMTNRS